MSTTEARIRRPVVFDQPHRLGEVLRSGWVVRNARRQLARDVDGDDVGTLVGHSNRMRATLPAGGSGDERDLAGESVCHLGSCCAALTSPPPMMRRWISLVPSYSRSSRTSR